MKGFTLIEVLVVLLITAIVTSIAVFSVGNFNARREKIWIETFSQSLKATQTEAIITPAILQLHITAKGYYVARFEKPFGHHQGKWIALQDTVLSHPHFFAHKFTVHLFIKNHAAKNILFLPSGFVTPFVVKLKGKRREYVIDSDLV